MKKRKNIDLTEDCIKALTKHAVDKGTVFKLLVEDVLENMAKSITLKNKKS